MVRDIMSYCPECGKRVAPTAKFCRNCGASQLEESPSPTPPAAVPKVILTCASCGNPLSQDETSCGVCGAGEGETRPQGVAAPPAAPGPAPIPVPSPSLSCTSCGMTLNPGTRFCGGCGSPVKGDGIPSASKIPAAVVASPSPQPPVIPPPAPQSSQPAGMRVCRSCGNVIKPGDKFCGKCLAKIVDPTSESPLPVTVGVPPPPPPPVIPDAGVGTSTTQPAGMRVCRSCGNVIKPGDKFCGKCLAKVVDPTSESPLPVTVGVPPVPPPPPPPVIPDGGVGISTTQPAGMRVCRSCGNVIKPGDKFCGKCLAKVVDPTFESPAPLKGTTPPVFPPPGSGTIPSQSQGIRLCRSCGYVINPGDKFCKKCLAKVPDDSPPASAQVRQPDAGATASSAPLLSCTSCGSPLGGIEKFCGICGTPVASVSPVSAARSPAGTMTCTKCGAPISATTRFCGGCGMAVGAVSASETISSAAPPTVVPPQGVPGSTVVNGEEVMGVIANARKMKMFGASWDTYTLVVTNRRMIFAQMTQTLLNAAILEAQAKAKAEGKGFFAIVKDQMAAQFRFAIRYETMTPEQSLTETAGNFAIENPHITAISLKTVDSGEMEYSEFKIIIESSGGKAEYLIGEDDRFINLLKSVYGERVHMPFGYFRAGGVRLKFF